MEVAYTLKYDTSSSPSPLFISYISGINAKNSAQLFLYTTKNVYLISLAI